MNTRALVLFAAVTTSLLVCTPAALASPRHTDTDRHHHATSWADLNRGSRSDLHRDGVWRNFDSRDDSGDDSDSSDDSSDGADESDTGDSTSDTTSDPAVAETGTQAVAGGTGAGGGILTGTSRTITASNTGFSFFDNSPPSSADICCPKIHSKAGGTGTRQDPISVAVPGSGGQGMELAAGTLIYYAAIRRYGIIEDSGATKMSKPHFDWWVGGQGFSKSSSESCMSAITRDAPIIINPAAGLPVTVGPLTGQSGCHI